MRALGLALLALVIAAQPALADWQDTSWGQPLEEVLAARQGVERTDAETRRLHSVRNVGEALAAAEYDAGTITTDALFLFDEGRLSGVNLRIRSMRDAFDAVRLLERQYGAPEKDEASETLCKITEKAWRDREGGNYVEFSLWDCAGEVQSYVLYTPLESAEQSGF